MIALPPLRSQNTSAALSSEDRSIDVEHLLVLRRQRSGPWHLQQQVVGDEQLDHRGDRDGAAVAVGHQSGGCCGRAPRRDVGAAWRRPRRWPARRGSSSPTKDAAGSSGGASGRGASGPAARRRSAAGRRGAGGGVPYTLRLAAGHGASTAAVTATSLDGRRRIASPPESSVERGTGAADPARPSVCEPNGSASVVRAPASASRFHCMRARLAQLTSCLRRDVGIGRPVRSQDAPDTPEPIGSATRNHRRSADASRERTRKSHR